MDAMSALLARYGWAMLWLSPVAGALVLTTPPRTMGVQGRRGRAGRLPLGIEPAAPATCALGWRR